MYHVTHRLNRYGVGRQLDYNKTTSEHLAEAALETLSTNAALAQPFAAGAARRAAALIAEVL